MSEIEADLLISSWNIHDLPGSRARGADKRFVRLNSLLKDVSRKKLIFAGELKINTSGRLIVIEWLR